MRKLFLAFAFVLFGSLHAQTGVERNLGQNSWVDTSTIPATFHYTWWGTSGKHYLVQVSEDLNVWSFLPNYNPAGANGPLGVEFTYESPRIFVRAWQFDPQDVSGFADSDTDGVPDVWEEYYFGNKTTITGDRDADQNGDGIPDWEAWLVGLNPAAPLPDRVAPTWPSGAGLTISGESETGFTLSWSEAADNGGGTVKYVLYRNGQPQGPAASSSTRQVSFAGLSGWQRWNVLPVDAAGNFGGSSIYVEREVGQIVDVALSVRARNRLSSFSKWGFPPLQSEPELAPVVRSFARRVTTEKEFASSSSELGEPYSSSTDYTRILTEARTPSGGTSEYGGTSTFSISYPLLNYTRTRVGNWAANGTWSGTETVTDGGGTTTTPLDSSGAPSFPAPSGTVLVSTSTEYEIKNTTSDGYTSFHKILSEPISDADHEGALIARWPSIETLPWGSGAAGSSRDWSLDRLSLSLGDSQYKVVVPVTLPGRYYRVQWLEVFYPESTPGQPAPPPVAQTVRQVVLEGTGEQVESSVFTLSPPSADGTISLMPMGAWLNAPKILGLNDNYDERIDDEEMSEPWIRDFETPSPVKSDGSLALNDMIPLYPGGGQSYGQAYRFGPNTSSVRLSITQGAERARMIAIAPVGSGGNNAYTEADWAIVQSGEELLGKYYGRKDSAGNSLSDWGIYMEGMAPGKVVTSLGVGVLGQTLISTAETYVVKVELLARDWKTGDIEPVAGAEPASAPRPEVELSIDSAAVVDGNKVRVVLSGIVRDPLSEMVESDAQKVAGVVFYVNGEAQAGLGNLASIAGNPAGVMPWQPRVFEAPFSKTLEIPVQSPRSILIRAKTTPNAAGQSGWADAMVVLGRLAADNPPPALVSMALKWAETPSASVINQIRVSPGSSIPTSGVPVLTETGANTNTFTGQMIVDGVARDASVTISFESPSGIPGLSIDGLAIYKDDAGVDVEASGLWSQDSTDPLAYRLTAMHSREGVLPPLRVLDTINLGGTTEESFAPVVARIDGLQDAQDDEALPAFLTDGSGETQEIRPFTFSPEYHYLVKPSFRQAPCLAIATSPVLYAPDQRVGILRAGQNSYVVYAPGQPAVEGTSVYVENETYGGRPPVAPRSNAATFAQVLFWYNYYFNYRPELPKEGGKPVPMYLFDVFTDANCAYEIVNGNEVEGTYLKNYPSRLLIKIGRDLDPISAAFGLLEAYESLLHTAPVYGRLTSSPALISQRNANVKVAVAPLRELGLAVMEAQFSFINEGADVVMSIEQVAEGNVYAALGVIPGIPAGVGKVVVVAGGGATILKLALQGRRLELHQEYLRAIAGCIKQAKKGEAMLINTIDAARARFIYLRAEGEVLTRAELAHMYDVSKIMSVKKKVSRKLLRENLEIAGHLDPSTALRKFQAHHDLPLEFEREFVLVGLDPNNPDYGRWIPEDIHSTWSNGSPGSGGKFNKYWRDFFFDPDTSLPVERTRAEVLSHLNDARSGAFKYE